MEEFTNIKNIKFIRIEAPHFIAGIEVYAVMGYYGYDETPIPIHRVSPIIKYMRGWPINKIKDYCKKKDWKIIIT